MSPPNHFKPIYLGVEKLDDQNKALAPCATLSLAASMCVVAEAAEAAAALSCATSNCSNVNKRVGVKPHHAIAHSEIQQQM